MVQGGPQAHHHFGEGQAILHRIQQLIHEKVVFAPIWVVAGLSGVGPRVEEPGIGVIPGYAFSAPYEDVKLKVR